MASTESNPGGEKRYSLSIGGHSLGVFVQRPISSPATEGTIAFLDGTSAKGNPCRGVGVFRNGEWRSDRGGRMRFEPQYWTVLDRKAADV